MSTPIVIIKGRIVRKEFQEPLRQCTELLESLGIDYRINPTSDGEPIDFALFFQSYPHEFLRDELSQLRRANPFAPFYFVLGACCEGMLRTAGLLDSPFYRYVHAWQTWEIEQIRLFLTEQPSLFSLPMTAGDDEIALWIDKDSRRYSENVCRLPSLILTRFGPFGNDSAMNRLIAEEQRRQGFDPLFSDKLLPEAFSGTILADADYSPREKILDSIQSLRCRFADNDFTVYVDSPRIDEKEAYTQAGATRVLPKIR